MAFVLIMLSVLKIKGLYMFRSPVHLQIPISAQLQGSSLWDVGPSTQIRTVQKFRTHFFYHQPKYEKHLKVIPEDETPKILNSNCSPTSEVKSVSPNCSRVHLIMVLVHQLLGWFWELSIHPHLSTHQVSSEFQPLPQHVVSWCKGMLFTRLSSSFQSSFSMYNGTRRICFPILLARIEQILWKSTPCIYNRCVVQDESCACCVTIHLIKLVVTIK